MLPIQNFDFDDFSKENFDLKRKIYYLQDELNSNKYFI